MSGESASQVRMVLPGQAVVRRLAWAVAPSNDRGGAWRLSVYGGLAGLVSGGAGFTAWPETVHRSSRDRGCPQAMTSIGRQGEIAVP